MLGMAFGAVYLALPAITGAFLPEPISIFAFPFKDLTSNVEGFLPAVPVMIAFDLGLVISGMVLPFWAMVGSFIGLVRLHGDEPDSVSLRRSQKLECRGSARCARCNPTRWIFTSRSD